MKLIRFTVICYFSSSLLPTTENLLTRLKVIEKSFKIFSKIKSYFFK